MYVTYSSFRKRLDSPSISFNLYKITIYYLNFFVNKTNKNTKTILLAGSSGYIGRNVLDTLLSRGYQVVCIGRNFSDPYALRKQKDVVFYKIDLCSKNDFKNLSEKFSSIHAIISCIGTRSGGYKDSWNVEYKANKNLLEYGKFIQIRHFILLSAICVQKPMLEFQFAKLAFEHDLIASSITYSIVRPTAFFKSISGQIEKVKSGKSFVFFDNGTSTSCKPISERNLAEFICDCLILELRMNKVLPIGGAGSNYTPKEQGELLFRLLGQTPKFLNISSSIFTIFNCFLSPVSLFSQKIKDLKEFSRIGHYYATESMLLWDEDNKRYSAEKTPEYGNDSLEDFYRHVIEFGNDGQELGDHKLF